MFTVLSAEAFNVVDTFETALDSIQTSFNGMAGAAIPIGLGIAAVMMVVPLGMKLFHKVAK